MKKHARIRANLRLSTRIEIKAELLVGKEELKKVLLSYPCFEEEGSEGKLRYIVNDPELNERYYVIEFDERSISIWLYSSISPLYFMDELLIRMLSITAFLKNEYRVQFEGLAPYFIEALSSQKLIGYLKDFELKPHVHNGDLVLAKRIVSLVKENNEVRKQHLQKASDCTKLLQNLIVSKYNYSSSLDLIRNETGLSESEIKEALRGLPRIGYKVIYTAREKFNVVSYEG